MDDTKEFLSWIDKNYLHISESDRSRILLYGELLVEGSSRLSLVSRGDRERIFMRHVRECLEPDLVNRLPQDGSLIDVGSGGGLPGIPIAMVRKNLEVTVLEPRGRKAAFLERAVLKLNLENVLVEQRTLEGIPQNLPGKLWNGATARAISWTPRMATALEKILSPQATLIRFGADTPQAKGVTRAPIPLSPGRAIQLWPRPTWPSLPTAS